MPQETDKERAIRALKFVKVALTKDGYLTDISVAMLIVEMERRGIKFSKSPHQPTRYEVVGKYGDVYGPFHNVVEAYAYADAKWPDEEQDKERSGKGWDVQVVGADR